MLERFRLYQSAFPMVTYRLILAHQVMAGDRIFVPESLDQDEVEASFLGQEFRPVIRVSLAGDVVSIFLEGEDLRADADDPILLEEDPQAD